MFRKAEEFEKPIRAIEEQMAELARYPQSLQRDARLERLQAKLVTTREDIYGDLSRWQTILVARHPKRPYTLDYIEYFFKDFVEMQGDRAYGDDAAIVAGFADFGGRTVCVVGHQKGRDTKGKLKRNFGMPHPEGYRKALAGHASRREIRTPGTDLHARTTPGLLSRVGRRAARRCRGHRGQSARDDTAAGADRGYGDR